MEVRFAMAKDVPGILSLLKQVGKVHHQGRPDIFRSNAQKYGASQILAMLDSFKTPIFVAVDEKDKVLGYGFCMIKEYEHDPVIADHTELYIDDLCVDENCRGQHIGKTLYDYANAYAKAAGCQFLTLNVWCGNESAMKFYENAGLTPRHIMMEKTLC